MNYCSTGCPGRLEPHICASTTAKFYDETKTSEQSPVGYFPISTFESEVLNLLNRILFEIKNSK